MANQPKFIWRVIGAVSILSIPLLALSLEVAKDDPSVSASEIMPKAAHSVLLDVAKFDGGFVAVGERGHIITSSNGKTWQQVSVPSRSTLTTVSVQGAAIWAAGHDGVILHSSDAGKTWQRQRAQPWSADSQELTNGSPVLDTLFIDAQTGYAVGAYSLILKTVDGGSTWQALSISGDHAAVAQSEMVADSSGVFSDNDLALGAESDPHLNAIARTDSGTLLVMGERGAGFRSNDEGQSWQKIRLPYAGSMFGLLSLGGEKVLAFGLRGNVYQTDNAGSSWQKVTSGTQASLLGGTLGDDGSVLLVGGNGTLLVRKANASSFTAQHVQMPTGQSPSLSAIIANGNEYLLTSDLGTINTRVQ